MCEVAEQSNNIQPAVTPSPDGTCRELPQLRATRLAFSDDYRGIPMGFTKLDEGIVFSSIMGEDDSVFRVWIVILATCKSNGISPISPVFLSAITKKPINEIERCLNILESPDTNSRTKEYDGRRIQIVDGGIQVLNYHKYREQTSSDFHREKMRRYRDKKNNCSTTVELRSASTSVSSSNSDSVSSSVEDKSVREEEKWHRRKKIEITGTIEEYMARYDKWISDSTEDYWKELKLIFPNVNFQTEEPKIRRWLEDNPEKRKKDINRFISGWLGRVRQ